MTDLIERDDVIIKIKSCISYPADNEWDTGYNTAMAKAKHYIQNAPAVNHWIPCNKRMPEDGVNVNITWTNKTISDDKDDKFVGTALRLNGVWYWYPLSSRFLVEIDEECGIEVLAWMPMPDAYEPPEKE